MREHVRDAVAKRIAGDIVMASEHGPAMRKWREAFGATQHDVARVMGVTPSVISDYEKNKRTPGVRFLKRFVNALMTIDEERGWPTVKRLAEAMGLGQTAILDMMDFSTPAGIEDLVAAVKGAPINSRFGRSVIYGYTVIDSYQAITSMRGNEFWRIMGTTTTRALIFTKVRTGRSPMIAVRVAPVKPAAVVLHGPSSVDPLAIMLADAEGIPLILSTAESEEELIVLLRRVFSGVTA